MLDTHAIVRSLTDADLTPEQADAITAAVISAREQADHVTGDQFKAGLAELRAEMAALDTRLSGQIAELRGEMAALDTRLSGQIAELRGEMAALDTRLSGKIADVRADVAKLDTRISTDVAKLDTRISTEVARLDTRISTEAANVRAAISHFETRLIKWTIGTVLATAGATLGIVRLLG